MLPLVSVPFKVGVFVVIAVVVVVVDDDDVVVVVDDDDDDHDDGVGDADGEGSKS